jgi:SOS-response transcriptional repressor LexA
MLPEYRDGDIVLMDHDQAPKNGDTVAALIDGSEATLKVFSRDGDQVVLTPLNRKKHRVQRYHVSRVTIQGVLIELVRRSPRRRK